MERLDEIFHAMIVETVIPALDGASKDPAYIKVKLRLTRLFPSRRRALLV